MGNHHSSSHTLASIKPRKNVHWKSAGRPAVPGKPNIFPILSDDEPNSITLRWAAAGNDGGAPLQGYQVECNRLGSAEWIRTVPPVVVRPELVLTGLEPPHRYQFRVAALNAVGRSDYSELSDVLTVSSDRYLYEPPSFLRHLEDVTSLENDKTEFHITFTGVPTPTIAWFKDDYEIFSSRRTAITTTDSSSMLVFHQTLASDEGDIKCTATNRAGHAVSKAHLSIESAPKLRYPRQYEDGLLYETNETIFLKTTIVGKPTPTIEWHHDGKPITPDIRVEIVNTSKFSVLKIQSALRSDRGEYQIHAKNSIGEDSAAFLVTITAPPDPPRNVSVIRQVDRSVTLDWQPPEDDGGCGIGNYIIEYYRSGWNVWLKATTSRKTNATLFDLIEGSDYRFRVKAESPYGVSAPSEESHLVRIPGRAVDMDFLAVESQIITKTLTSEEADEVHVSPVPRRNRSLDSGTVLDTPEQFPNSVLSHKQKHDGSNEFMLILYPKSDSTSDKTEKRKSFQLDLEDALSPPPISFSMPDLSSRCILSFKTLRNAVSSTELLHERAMARFYKAVEMEERQCNNKDKPIRAENKKHIPKNNNTSQTTDKALNMLDDRGIQESSSEIMSTNFVTPEIFIKTDSIENKEYKYSSRQTSQESQTECSKWQSMSFDEDYTASTVSDHECSDEGSVEGDVVRELQYSNEDITYNPRNKTKSISSSKESDQKVDIERSTSVPLPDPNFIPKPILKKREPEITLLSINSPQNSKKVELRSTQCDYNSELNTTKDEKMTIFKKISKVQKPFQFPNLFSKKESEKREVLRKSSNESNITANKMSNDVMLDDPVVDEGRTIIEHYGNIVKEYGKQRTPKTTLYLNTEELKSVAEKQLVISETQNRKTVKSIKPALPKTSVNKQALNIGKSVKSQSQLKIETKDPNVENKESNILNKYKNRHAVPNKQIKQIVLKKTERATIVIPIDYQDLEKKAKVTVRSVIDYTVDVCLLILAFWVYFFKDERLAIPFLLLIIYRQLQENILFYIPEWYRRYTPNWLSKKTA